MISARQNTAFSTNKTLKLGNTLVSLQTPVVMGILNVTPDSFYDGGKYISEKDQLKQVEKMLDEGASIIDVGGYSSRPGAGDVPINEERKRTSETIKSIYKEFPQAFVSIDTFHSEIAQAAVDEGAQLVNDISCGSLDAAMLPTVAKLHLPYVCMHMRGTPATMSNLANYENVLYEVIEYLHQKLALLQSFGINDVILDPGFGFAKTAEHNFQLLSTLDQLKIFEVPILAGLSRKSMIWKTLQITPEDALNGTTALNMIALSKGASILRVHDVKEAVQAIKLFSSLPHPDMGVY